MDAKEFLRVFRPSIRAIKESRLFQTERGYQGQLVAELSKRLDRDAIWPDNPIVETEYQKRAKDHGTTIRPDLIVHVPFDRGVYDHRQDGNYVVVQLKRKATLNAALKDFTDLDYMFRELRYELGIFVNIDSDETFFDDYAGDFGGRLHCFAVRLIKNLPTIVERP
jgi:hypothetical protein